MRGESVMEASEIEKAKRQYWIDKRAEEIRMSWLLFCLVGIPVLVLHSLRVVWNWLKGGE